MQVTRRIFTAGAATALAAATIAVPAIAGGHYTDEFVRDTCERIAAADLGRNLDGATRQFSFEKARLTDAQRSRIFEDARLKMSSKDGRLRIWNAGGAHPDYVPVVYQNGKTGYLPDPEKVPHPDMTALDAFGRDPGSSWF